jgi:hypothetical protein
LSNSKAKPIEGEIVTPTQLDRILGKSQEPDIPALDALLERFDQLLRASVNMTNLNNPENWFGELLGGMDYRIAIKTERGQALNGLVETFMQSLDQFEAVEKKIRAINHEQYERYIDRVRFAKIALEEQQKLEAVATNARLQRQIEAAKAEGEIARHQAEVRKAGLEGRPTLPPPPPPPAPAPVDELERKRQAAQRERKLDYALKIDAAEAEEDYQDKLTSSVTTRILKVFGDPASGRGQKKMRIRNLIDTYGIVEEFLPFGVVELMQEEE